jgi:hypothetical protein
MMKKVRRRETYCWLIPRSLRQGWLIAVVTVAGCGRLDFAVRADNDAAAIDAQVDAASVLPVVATLTVDNGFSFIWDDGMSGQIFVRGKNAITSPEIFDCPVGFGPEEYSLPVPAIANGYLYMAAWADATTQAGFLGKFVRAGKTTLTGDIGWEVCAVGEFYDRVTMGPSATRIISAIAECNAGTTASRGWVNATGPVTPGAKGELTVGDFNDGSGIWNLTCQNDVTGRGIPQSARWIWWDPDDGGLRFDNAGNRTQTFHIYRIASTAL